MASCSRQTKQFAASNSVGTWNTRQSNSGNSLALVGRNAAKCRLKNAVVIEARIEFIFCNLPAKKISLSQSSASQTRVISSDWV